MLQSDESAAKPMVHAGKGDLRVMAPSANSIVRMAL
jgi:hypothetical protein